MIDIDTVFMRHLNSDLRRIPLRIPNWFLCNTQFFRQLCSAVRGGTCSKLNNPCIERNMFGREGCKVQLVYRHDQNSFGLTSLFDIARLFNTVRLWTRFFYCFLSASFSSYQYQGFHNWEHHRSWKHSQTRNQSYHIKLKSYKVAFKLIA